MTVTLLAAATLPLWLRLASRRAGHPDVWWANAPARLAASAVAMVAWLYWCGTTLAEPDAAVATVLGWLVLAAETASHPAWIATAEPVRPRHGASGHRIRTSNEGTPVRARCTACGTPLVGDRIPVGVGPARPARRPRSTHSRSRP